MALDSVNRFNYSSSSVSTLMMMPDGRLLLGVKLLLDGGVTETNLRTYLASYMFDVASLIEGPNDSAATNVAYDPQAAQGPAPGVVPAAGAQENSMDIDVAAIAGRAGTALAGVASED
jgi:hypothetical protein